MRPVRLAMMAAGAALLPVAAIGSTAATATTADSLTQAVDAPAQRSVDDLLAAPADAPQLENAGVWKAEPTMVCHTSAYRKGEFLNNLARKLFGYAMGRELNEFDECVIKDCLKALSANEYRSSALVEEIVLSFAFQHRYGKK